MIVSAISRKLKTSRLTVSVYAVNICSTGRDANAFFRSTEALNRETNTNENSIPKRSYCEDVQSALKYFPSQSARQIEGLNVKMRWKGFDSRTRRSRSEGSNVRRSIPYMSIYQEKRHIYPRTKRIMTIGISTKTSDDLFKCFDL